jgi:hypothetical protein
MAGTHAPNVESPGKEHAPYLLAGESGGGTTPTQSLTVYADGDLGLDTNPGTASAPVKTIPKALEILAATTRGAKAPGNLGPGGLGRVVCTGKFQVASSSRLAKCTVKTTKTAIFTFTGTEFTAADVGAYVVSQPSIPSQITEGTWITAVNTGTKEVTMNNTFANTEEQAFIIVKPAIVLPPGVELVGLGRGAGNIGYPSFFPTLIEDTGTGITIQGESGSGEKQAETFVRMVIENLTIKGNQPSSAAPTAGNMYGFAVGSCYGLRLRGVLFIEHGQWGAKIENKAAVVGEIGDCEFRNNGPINSTGQVNNLGEPNWGATPSQYSNAFTYSANNICWEAGVYYKSKAAGNTGNKPSTDGGVHWEALTGYASYGGTIVEPAKLETGGLLTAAAPNTFITRATRCIENSGVGANLCGVGDFGSGFSKNRSTICTSGPVGTGLACTGTTVNGGTSSYAGWIEGNENAGVTAGTAIVTLIGCMFQGNTKVKQPYGIEAGSVQTTIINCYFQQNVTASIKEANSEAPIFWIGCQSTDPLWMKRKKTEWNLPASAAENIEGTNAARGGTAGQWVAPESAAAGLKAVAGYNTPGSRFDEGQGAVRLRGAYEAEAGKEVAKGAPILTLPALYRPKSTVTVAATQSAAGVAKAVLLTIASTGVITSSAVLATTELLYLDNITFTF